MQTHSPQRDGQLAGLCDEQRSAGRIRSSLQSSQAQPRIRHRGALQQEPGLHIMLLQPTQQCGRTAAQVCKQGWARGLRERCRRGRRGAAVPCPGVLWALRCCLTLMQHSWRALQRRGGNISGRLRSQQLACKVGAM